ncbi:hypothetical protein H0O03_04750 [Candidatus Micrarchaeota archaeon]|nr:hypothetical protein [Candidatus Micrarchaeota archaeon]
MEFEHKDPKFEKLDEHTLLLFAGDSLIQREIADRVKNKAFQTASIKISERLKRRLAPASKIKPIHEIAKITADVFEELRLEKIEKEYFLTRKISMNEFYREGKINQFPAQLAAVIDQQSQTASLGSEVLVTGVDSRGSHIHYINERHTNRNFDRIGFHAIGIGAVHALSSFLGDKYHSSLPFSCALYTVYKAKKRAEAAPGVGELTDMLVINPSGTQSINLDKLKELYDAERHKIEEESSEIKNIPDEILLR